MSYEESDARKKSNQGFRTVMDIGMGLFYIALGLWLVIYKAFGNMAVPPFIAYLLGCMMFVGGAFRFYKGMKAALPTRKKTE